MDNQSKIILISGPTASGKSNFAIKIAKKINGEIINADSMQVYKIFKILTARPNKKEKKNIKHHLYGMIDLNKNFSTGKWLKLTIKSIKDIKQRKKIPILVGGTGLYFQSLINGLVKIPEIPTKVRSKVRSIQKKEGQKKFYKKLIKLDPNIKNKFDPNDTQRSIRAYEIKVYTKISMYEWMNKTKSEFKDYEFLKLYLDFKREKLVERISLRTIKMIENGAVNEVKKFIKLKIKKDHSINKVIGIDELTQYLNNQINLEQAQELISIKTRQYAKRQATWARSRMISWKKINPMKISDFIKRLNKSTLKLDQLM
ncbi:tRNA (adenosine(37)-N6)-dimethylallyltransferase MiaA [Candidatus Pelagibacter bacterium]|nr:tRNA (adenosine(37)-N6)-dimethylallyltransferase MiaA [Candidatus Pelagibacter bacterium]|tara:strand:+ start:192 stop:1133 length:942 start_codon:yes stop_codon:yes gene_type:complete